MRPQAIKNFHIIERTKQGNLTFTDDETRLMLIVGNYNVNLMKRVFLPKGYSNLTSCRK